MHDILTKRGLMQQRWSLLAVWALAAALVAGCTASPAASKPKVSEQATPATQAQTAPTPPTTGGQPKVAKSYSSPPAISIDPQKDYQATLHTNQGDITIQLLPKDAPVTVNSFVFLAREGFYEGVKFHRVVKGFVIQAGDPTGTGAGGPGYRFQDELPKESDYDRGVLAMANAGPNTNGSQFFITLDSLKGGLPKNYTIFGKVIAGMDAVDKIAAVPVQRGGSGEASSPTVDVRIDRVSVTEK